MKIFIERPFVFVSLAYAGGIVVGTLTRHSIDWPWFALIALVSFAALLFIRQPKIFLPIAFLFILAAGACSYQISQIVPAQDISNPVFHGRGSLQGRVVSEVDQKSKGKKEIASFTVEADSWWRKQDKALVTGKVRVTLLNAGMIPSYGDEVRIRGTLSFPKSAMNPGEFDYRNYLEKQNIRASFLGFGKKSLRIFNPHPSFSLGKGEGLEVRVIRKIFDLRRAIHDCVYQLVRAPERDILLSLITGERANIPREITDDFVKTGTVHVLAISGFQVSLVAGLTFLALRGLGIPIRLAAFIAGTVLVFYVPLAGWQLPVQRAGIMGLVVMGSVMLSRASDVISSLFLAFFVLLLINPNSLYSIAFQLSFISVLSILGFIPKMNEWLWMNPDSHDAHENDSWLAKIVRSCKVLFASTLAATLGTWPLVLYYFHVLSLTSLLANFFIVPLTTLALFSLIIVLGISLVWMPLAGFLVYVPSFLVKVSIQAVHFMAQFPIGYLYLPSPHWSVVLLYYVFLGLYILGVTKAWHLTFKCAFVIGLLGISLALILPMFQSREEIVILNVPGSSVVFAEGRSGKTVLFNGGKGRYAAQDYWTVMPFLKERGIKKLDTVFLTSMKRKYWGGFVRILDHCRFHSVVMPWPYSREDDFQNLLQKIRKQNGNLSGLKVQSRFLLSESISVEIENSHLLKLLHGNIRMWMIAEEMDLSAMNSLSVGGAEILYLSGKQNLADSVLDEVIRLKPKVVVLANGPSQIDSLIKDRLLNSAISLFNLKETGALIIRPGHEGFEIQPFCSSQKLR